MEENYKEKYEEALNAARKELGIDRKEWEVVQQVLAKIFPQLHESDDERTRKEMISFLKSEKAFQTIDLPTSEKWVAYLEKQKETCKENTNSFTDKSEDERIRKRIVKLLDDIANGRPHTNPSASMCQDAILYLERQKEEEGYEAIPVESTLEYKLGFKAGKESEKQKEPVVEDKGLYYYDGEKFTYCGCPAIEDNPYDFAMSQQEGEQKEQKKKEMEWRVEGRRDVINNPEQYGLTGQPTDWSDITPIIDHLDNLGNTAMADTLRRFRPQKQEWSDEDKDKFNRLYRILPQCVDCNPRIIGDKECVELQDFLKYVCNNKPVWNDAMSEHAKKLADYLRYKGLVYDAEFVESFVPQHKWKPREEQMIVLREAIRYVESCESNFKFSGSALESLYSDLLKLKQQ